MDCIVHGVAKSQTRLNHFHSLTQPILQDFSGGSVVKSLPASAGDMGSIPGLERFPWRRTWQPTPVFLPREPHEQRRLVCYSPWGCKESDTTQRLNNNNKPILFERECRDNDRSFCLASFITKNFKHKQKQQEQCSKLSCTHHSLQWLSGWTSYFICIPHPILPRLFGNKSQI